MLKATVIAVLVFAFLRFGMEPAAWFFYHASHALSIDGLYWGYRGFRMADFFSASWPYRTVACMGAGLLIGGLYWLIFGRKKNSSRAS